MRYRDKLLFALDNYLQARKKRPIPETEPPNTIPADLDRLLALRSDYMQISDCISNEIDSLQSEMEYDVSEKRYQAINKRLLSLYTKRAANTRQIQAIDKKIESYY